MPRFTRTFSYTRPTPALRLTVLGALLALAPAGCFFPEFTFEEGGAGGTTSSGGGGTGGTTSTTTSMTTGGTGGSTTSMGGTGGSTTSMGGTGGMTGGTGGIGGMTGGGGMGGTTTTSDTTSTMETTSSMPPLENCQNGIDDDGDGAADCMDSDCMDFSCVPAVPNTWSGYFLLYEGSPVGDPGCTEQFPMDSYVGNFNLNAPAATCAACACGSPSGEVCTPPSLIVGLDVPCGGTPSLLSQLFMPGGWGAVCTTAQDASGPYYSPAGLTICGPGGDQPCHQAITADAPTVSGGFCTPSGGMATVTPATWDGFGHACSGATLTGKGCAIGQTCLPKPADPYIGGLCIKKAGVQNCPAGQFSQKHVFFDDFTDSRTCTGCNCGIPTGSTCAGNITTHADSVQNQCLSPVATFPAGTCQNLTGNPAIGNSKFTVTSPPAGGSCTPGGGMPSGTAVGTFPQTFCCMPDQSP
ncbi:MAG: hypothetical protein R3B70_30980 [Polyangiaceae bacterium]